MAETHTSRRARPSATSTGGALLLETEIAELKRANTHLQRRLEEAEMQAELRWRAARLLALPFPDGR